MLDRLSITTVIFGTVWLQFTMKVLIGVVSP